MLSRMEPGTRQVLYEAQGGEGRKVELEREAQHARGGETVGPSPRLQLGLELPSSAGRGFRRACTGASAYPGALSLDGFDVQAVLHGLAGAAGLRAVLRAPAAALGAGLAVPVLLEQRGPDVHVVALLLGDVSIWAVHGFHVFPERAGVRVALSAAWDLADVGFLGREAGAVRNGTQRHTENGCSPVLLRP